MGQSVREENWEEDRDKPHNIDFMNEHDYNNIIPIQETNAAVVLQGSGEPW